MLKTKKMGTGGANIADVYAYLEMRHKMRHSEEMLVSEAEEQLEEPLLNMMIPEMKREWIIEENLRMDTIIHCAAELTDFLEDDLPCPMERALCQGCERDLRRLWVHDVVPGLGTQAHEEAGVHVFACSLACHNMCVRSFRARGDFHCEQPNA